MEKNREINYTREESILKKTLFRSVAFFGLLLPVLGTILFGGTELIMAYFSVLNNSTFGVVSAQILSIFGDVFNFSCLVLLYAAVGAHIMSFGGKRSISNFLILLAAPIASALTAFLVMYALVVAGWHDYSLSMFFEYIPVYFAEAGFSCLVNVLVSIAVFIAFYLTNTLQANYNEDKSYKKTLKLVLFVLIIIKTVSLGLDIVLSDISYTSFNGIIGGIVFPILYEVLELGATLFALRHFIFHISKKATELGINFG